MGTIKILGFDEDGNAQRLKIRIARFLDYDPVTASDKSNIRSTLGITSQGGLGDLLAANNLDDVASLDTTKANLEIPDVGTGPSQVPLNQHLGTMAYQDIAGVSMGVVEADSLDVGGQSKAGSLVVYDANGNASNSLDVTYSGSSGVANIQADSSGGSTALTFGTSNAGVVGTRMTIDSSGRVGIGTSSPGSYYSGTDDLVVAGASGDRGITIATANTANGGLMFADSDSTTIGRIQYSHGTNEMKFRVNNTEVWSINSSGNLVANGTAIDFGSTNTTAGVTVTGSTLDHYEEGTWTVTNDGDATGVINASEATYTRIGNIVTIRATFTVTTNFTGYKIGGLPYLPATNSISNSTSGTPVMTLSATSSPIIAHVLGNSNTVRFTSGTNLGSNHTLNTTHASYRVFLSYNV